MNYQFPIIKHIDDVLPAIVGRDEFIVAQKDGYQVVNYAVMMEDSFPPVTGDDFCPGCKEYKTERGDCGSQRCPDFVSAAAIRRECRGLVFDLEGKLINRRFHKFFNVNERDETRAELIDWNEPHVILDKLDGSMVSPCMVNGHVRWMTKMGITDTSMQAETHTARFQIYREFAEWYLESGWTPVFEWVSRQSRIVLDYAQDQLILTAMRENLTGRYMPYAEMIGVAEYWDMPLVKAYDYEDANLIEAVRNMQDLEGVVVRFDSGHMVKIKAEWYVLRHKSKDAITREKNVLDYIVNERVDDVLPFLQAEDQSSLLKFQDKFWEGFNKSLAAYEDHYQNVVQAGVDRKQYALEWKPIIEKTFPFAPQYAFGRFAGRDGRDMLLDHVRKNIGTQTRVNETRKIWGGHEWSYNFEGDE